MAFATSNQKWSRGEDVIVFRRVCDSNSKILLAHALKNFNWCSLYQTESCDHMLAYFMDTLNAMLDYYMPLCPFKRHSSDKPWVTDRFRQLIRCRQFAFCMCSINDIEMQFRDKQNGYASNIMTIKLNSCEQLHDARKWWHAVKRFIGTSQSNKCLTNLLDYKQDNVY